MRPHVFVITVCGLIVLGAAVPTRAAADQGSTALDAASAAARPSYPVVLTAEAGVGQTKASQDSSKSFFFYQRSAGRWSASERLDLTATLRVTEDLAQPADSTSRFTTGRDVVFFGAADATYQLTPHFNASLGVNGSPTSTRDVATANPIWSSPSGRAPGEDPMALVRTRTRSFGAAAELGYDSFDPDEVHDIDGSLEASVGWYESFTEQTIVAPDAPARLGTSNASLQQARLGGAATLTIAEKTDVGVDGAYFLYDNPNPDAVGSFATDVHTNWGAGLPMLPPRWTVRPEVAQRIGPISMRAHYQYSELTIWNAAGHTLGGKIQLAIGRLKFFINGSYRTDVFTYATGETWSAGAGLSWRL
jgi:hypothetical protein